MLSKYLILIPFNLPWEWSTDYTNQTAFYLAKRNTIVCYMIGESFSIKELIRKRRLPILIQKKARNIYLFYPILFIPFRRFKYIYDLNQKLSIFTLQLFLKLLDIKAKFKDKILWIFDPNIENAPNFFGEGWKVLYDCVDFFQATALTSSDKKRIIKRECLLTKKADLVVANSIVLQNHLNKYRKDVYLVPQGFRVKDFENKKNYKAPKINAKKPLIGFAGAVNYRLDYDLLLPLATNNKNWNFVIWGPVLESERTPQRIKDKMKELVSLPNVTTGFLKDRKKLPGIFNQFDISMIPYDVSQDFNKYCYPMKLFEFFYLGKPVISTEVEELKRFPEFVIIGKSYVEWERIIKTLLQNPWPQKYKDQEKKLAIANSWENKIEAILSHL